MSVLDNLDPEWLEQQFLLWKESPERVSPEWRAFFSGYELGSGTETGSSSSAYSLKQSAVQSLIYRYRDIGHYLACTDPLSPCLISHPLLDLEVFGLNSTDLDTVFHIRRFTNKARTDQGMQHSASLKEILSTLQETYCRSIGVEFMYIKDPAQRQWLIDRMEPIRNRPQFSSEEKLGILEKLLEATLFEEYLHRHYIGQKRFSLEGGESFLPLLEEVVRRAAASGIGELVLGMPHRGRLNVLANIFQKPYHNIFAEFQDNLLHGVVGEGDVKYHKGLAMDRNIPGSGKIHLTLVANPSHLEAVDGVVEGKTRARQEKLGIDGHRRVLPVLVHGDAAFSGQGVVAEIFNLSQLDGYRTGGTLHIVVNNQIGFTTLPADARSSRYATDVAKMVDAPVFHVHGEDPEAVVHAARLAFDYRQEFSRDVVVEVICYRRHGHNEGDEPYFTQPLMYQKIKDRPPVYKLYEERLLAEGVDPGVVTAMAAGISQCMEASEGKEDEPVDQGFEGEWHGVAREYRHFEGDTGVSRELLVEQAGIITHLPEWFHPHPKVAALLAKRRESIVRGDGIDWGTAETLAYATLLREGIRVRLSGQDSRRGTFNHRHAFVYDQESGAAFAPLAQVCREPRMFRVYDSLLSESAVLAFEYGYSVESPNGLTIWEAQFGDFANGAQVTIDQFIVSGETKWDRASGLVMLLPHGFEGQGAEHSSARIERYLQLCADNNIQVCFPTTPAQFFHLLRRQVLQAFRRPLVVFTPKSLFRHPLCVSRLDDITSGRFQEVIATREHPEQVLQVLICSGKVYYDLLEKKTAAARHDTVLIRIEQFYPLRVELLRELLGRFTRSQGYTWVQEEPENMGGWSFMRPVLTELLGKEPRYVGRSAAPAPATGSHRQHHDEQERLLAAAFV
jgi:2-oxoglutarate dehydrogenase E1 component